MNSTILLVDDSSMFLEIQKEFLQHTKAGVLTANDGKEALNITKTVRPDLIFMDLEMPRMDGASCCRAIKSESAFCTIPVVMVTAQKKDEDITRCYTAGCDAFVTKPLDRDAFLGVARRFLPNLDRREPRIKVSINSSLFIRNQTIFCRINNLSAGGAYLETDYFGTPNEVLTIHFTLPSGVRIECPGRIAWINRIDSAFPKGFGIKFALLSQHAKSSLNDFIEKSKTTVTPSA